MLQCGFTSYDTKHLVLWEGWALLSWQVGISWGSPGAPRCCLSSKPAQWTYVIICASFSPWMPGGVRPRQFRCAAEHFVNPRTFWRDPRLHPPSGSPVADLSRSCNLSSGRQPPWQVSQGQVSVRHLHSCSLIPDWGVLMPLAVRFF